MKDIAGIAKARKDVLICQSRVIFEDIIMRPSIGQQLDNELHGKSGAKPSESLQISD